MDKTTKKGIRYTDEQKKEVVDYALQYNSENGRGGQSKAAEKFAISQLTVSNWMKGAGAGKSSKAGKASKSSKSAGKNAVKRGRGGPRYTDEQKQEVIDYMLSYNAENGRGGQSKASAKFGVTPLTIMTWYKASGGAGSAKKKSAGRSATKTARGNSSSDISGKLSNLLELSNKISQAEAELEDLRSEFAAAKASL